MAQPRPRRPARPREEVYAAARAAIAEHGLARLTMAGLGEQLGMSAGHLLYYFGSKDQLLLETLRWSEAQLGERRGRELARPGAPVLERLDRYLELYLPEGPGDPRWILWIEVWSRSPGTAELRQGQLDIEAPWQDDLTALLTEGRTAGLLPAAGTTPARATQLRALLDGLAIPLAIGLPHATRPAALAQAREAAHALLGI
ncbi:MULTISPECIES: TetR/AcrR family transcriptional regulator [Kitasatospora]|uniref:Putative TetR family transcriptional regulator n=1 Tax=Kitasatospora setae (strain ATCC 33774 / DSM 43861 / JCM 3304 / KCC A-0304 / NBRC 14216 / KM-6054) TaxID=452652 RepID=E4N9B1_KITSK|nr:MULTISPECIES: TetR/AcrR family transcriptional regulator [Kitasatospora]BAJ27792.1 putative TetR family transcriptional regulator [Kitasatospora setae KM-6054]